MKLRQERLGHAGLRTTLGYTRTVGEDDRKLAEQLDKLYRPKNFVGKCAQLKKKASSPQKREALDSVA